MHDPPGNQAMKTLATLLAIVLACGSAWAQTEAREYLWPAGAPGALGTAEEDRPSVQIHLPPRERAVGAAVVVCPGGSYVRLAADHEGAQIARWLTERGVAALVLRYRLGPRYHHPVQLGDVLRAIRFIRARAAKLGVRADRIGVWGFSAGGHLASSAATLFEEGDARTADPVDRCWPIP
jgi:acetyl esterase/lipase